MKKPNRAFIHSRGDRSKKEALPGHRMITVEPSDTHRDANTGELLSEHHRQIAEALLYLNGQLYPDMTRLSFEVKCDA